MTQKRFKIAASDRSRKNKNMMVRWRHITFSKWGQAPGSPLMCCCLHPASTPLYQGSSLCATWSKWHKFPVNSRLLIYVMGTVVSTSWNWKSDKTWGWLKGLSKLTLFFNLRKAIGVRVIPIWYFWHYSCQVTLGTGLFIREGSIHSLCEIHQVCHCCGTATFMHVI